VTGSSDSGSDNDLPVRIPKKPATIISAIPPSVDEPSKPTTFGDPSSYATEPTQPPSFGDASMYATASVNEPTPPPSFGDASMYATATVNESSAVNAPSKILDLNRQLDVDKDLSAVTTDWASLGQEAQNDSTGSARSNEGNLWSSFKNKEQELRLKEKEREEREAKLAEERERAAEELCLRAEEVKRQQQEEFEQMRHHQELQQLEQQRLQDEEREAARKARQNANTVDLGEQSEMMDFMDQFS